MNYCGDCIWFKDWKHWCEVLEHRMYANFEACEDYEGWETTTEGECEDE